MCVAAIVLGAAIALIFPRQETRAAGQARADGRAARSGAAASRRRQAGPGQKTVVVLTGFERALQTDPSAADYDPVLLSSVYDMRPTALFSAEPRDEGFAIPRERALRNQVSSDLAAHFPDARVDKVVCHTSSCQITVQVPSGSLTGVYRYIQQPTMGGTQNIAARKVAGAADETAIVMTVLFSRAHRDHAVYGDWYKKHRAETIAALKEVGWLVPDE